MSTVDELASGVPADVVKSAIRAARRRGQDVAEVPVIALAQEAGVSRSTLLRRIGGSRRALDEAVRVRAVEGGAWLISERGLTAATLEAVAEAADCSVHSVYAAFGGRDELLGAIYERYSPIPDLRSLIAQPRADLEETVREVYRALTVSFGRLFQRYFPQALDSLGGWLESEIVAARIRPMPILLLVQQLIGPVVVHLLLRPAMARGLEWDLPGVEDVCAVFADNFLHAVAVPCRAVPCRAGPAVAEHVDVPAVPPDQPTPGQPTRKRVMTMRKSTAAAGTAAFFVVAPGTMVGLVPWLITRWDVHRPLPGWVVAQVIGAVLICAGLVPAVHAFVQFAKAGGTPAPVAPTEHLVVNGFNRYVRNPMYVGLLAVVIGQALLFGQLSLLLYAGIMWAVTASFVHWYEEPTLTRQFGADHETYRRAVPAWWPRRRPWTPSNATRSSP